MMSVAVGVLLSTAFERWLRGESSFLLGFAVCRVVFAISANSAVLLKRLGSAAPRRIRQLPHGPRSASPAAAALRRRQRDPMVVGGSNGSERPIFSSASSALAK
jgi:hypothetical protein